MVLLPPRTTEKQGCPKGLVCFPDGPKGFVLIVEAIESLADYAVSAWVACGPAPEGDTE